MTFWRSTMRFRGSMLLLLLVLPVVIQAGDSVDQQLSATKDGVVEIHNTRGEVSITGWDKDSIKISGELDDLATGLTFEVEDGVTLIRVEMPKHINYGDGSDLDIRVPSQSRVEFDGVSTDVDVNQVLGGTGVRTVSGDIRASVLDNRIRIRSVSGEVEVSETTGIIKVSSVSGDVELDIEASEIAVDAVSGEVRLELGDFDRLMTSTISGDLRIEGHLNNSGLITMKSVSGEISLRLNDAINAQISAKTGPGGDISNHLNDDEPEDIFPTQTKLQTTLGDGSGSIRMSTVTGEIRLLKGS